MVSHYSEADEASATWWFAYAPTKTAGERRYIFHQDQRIKVYDNATFRSGVAGAAEVMGACPRYEHRSLLAC